MANTSHKLTQSHTIDPNSGFCSQSRTFHSLRPHVPLPPPSQPLSLTDSILSLLPSTAITNNTTALIDFATDNHLTYSTFIRQIKSLASSLQQSYPSLSKGHVAFILTPSSLHVPVLYLSLLSLGVTVAPANPLSTPSELTHLIQLTKPIIAFATSSTAKNIPNLPFATILLDSPNFLSMLDSDSVPHRVETNQSDSAAILFSSGTTGLIKGVLLTHRNLIALIVGLRYQKYTFADGSEDDSHRVSLFSLPMFHVFGIFAMMRAMIMGETLVLMQRFDFEEMLKAVEKYKITNMPVSPPLVTLLVKSELVKKYDICSLRVLRSGGAPLYKEVADSFKAKFSNVEIVQGYGLTESGGVSRMIGADEAKRHGSAGRLVENMEARIVDPVTGETLSHGQKGELWLRGPTIMKGYVGDDKATVEIFDSEGWLKTGDLCYFDSDGFLFIVDRLKELIKYKAYQVAPSELEHILHTNLEIVDVAVIPYPDEDAGQIPMAFVVRKSGSNITAAKVMEYVAKHVSPYKKIRRVYFINSIPKSPAGKILRRELVNIAINCGSSKL